MVFFVSSANLSLRINGTIDGYMSNIRLRLNTNSTIGYDIYDLEAPPNPGNISVFYSIIPGYNLVIDSWNESEIPRTLNLSYWLPYPQSGTINFSWKSIFGSNLLGFLIYYGINSTYSSVGNVSSLRVNSSYSDVLDSTNQVYLQANFSYIPSLNVNINSSDGSNKTLADLYCYTTLIDPDPDHKMNVTVYWYKNSQLYLTMAYNNNYDTNDFFYAKLDNLNTTKGENWSCGIQTYDSFELSEIYNSSSLKILNSIPNITIIGPPDNNWTTNRTPTFYWSSSDSDGDSLSFQINITLNPGGVSTCVDNRNVASSNDNYYTVSPYLKCLMDNKDTYNWSVRAYDGENYSNWSAVRNISIQSVVDVNLVVESVNFGGLLPGDVENTSDGVPSPIILRNDGNVLLNVSANFSNLWTSNEAQNPSSYYQFKARNSTPECFDYLNSAVMWTNSTTTNISVIKWLNFTKGYQFGCNNASLDIAVKVPLKEPPQNRSSLIVIFSDLGEK
ncbi:MAG: hypothetical protein QXW97_02990 [Candidatus Pacearchaeota archaeon]